MTLAAMMAATRIVLGSCLAAYCVFAGIEVWAARKWHRARMPVNRDWTPPVTILKPVRGIDAEAYENFTSFCLQDYPPGRLQILFGALDPGDPALDLARRLQMDFPEQDIGVVWSGAEAPRGTNLKVCNLLAMLPRARHELLALCDSDMRVTPDYLRRIVAPFEPRSAPGPKVGLVTCPYRGCRAWSPAAILEALGIGTDFIPSTLLSRALEGVSFAFGSTIVLPRRILEEIGGFEALRDELADDFRLGNGVKRAGYEVVLSDYVVQDVLGAETFGRMWSRRLRWARTVRACRPLGYAGSFVTHGTALGLMFLCVAGFKPFGWEALACVLFVRAGVAFVIARLYTGDAAVLRWFYGLPISDLLTFSLYVASYCGNRIAWRGDVYRLRRGGRIERVGRGD